MASLCAVQSRRHSAHKAQFYGWDSPTESWHGPDELHYGAGGARHLIGALQRSLGRSWYGSIKCPSPDGPANRFFVVIHDLDDCALATIYCDESKAGPAEILVVIPAERRSRLRAEFPFEFLAFTSFLRATSAAASEPLHERMTAALVETCESDSLVFSITTGLWVDGLDYELSRCAEVVAIAMLQWAGSDNGTSGNHAAASSAAKQR